MPSSTRWPDAALAGLAASMRTFSAPTGLALHGRLTGVPRRVTFLAAAGEIALDKLPQATPRTDPGPLGGRIAAGAPCGRAVAGRAGVVSGAVAAFAGSYAFMRARMLVVGATGLPD